MNSTEKYQLIMSAVMYVICTVMTVALSGWFTTIVFRADKKNRTFLFSGHCICDYCGARIPTLYTLPFIGSKLLHGKSKCCGKSISYYPKLELEYTVIELPLLFLLGTHPVICGTASFAAAAALLIVSIKKSDISQYNIINILFGILSLAVCYGIYILLLSLRLLFCNAIQ